MRTSRRMRALVVGFFGMIVMAAAVSDASAATGLSISNGVSLATANGRLTLNAGGGLTETCFVTLGLQLSRSIAKRTLAQIGTVLLSNFGSSIRDCDLSLGGEVLNGITVGYIGFNGTLPNITGIRAQSNNARFLLNLPIIGLCLYTGTVPLVFNRNAVTGLIETVTLNAVNSLIAPAPCPSPASLLGVLTVLNPRPTVVLI